MAVDLPQSTRDRLGALLGALGREARDVRWVRAESIHLTMKFLGEVVESRMNALADRLSVSVAAVRAGFRIESRGIGTFGGRLPRVVWAGVIDPDGGLSRLQQAVESACVAEGFAPEARPYSPHLTLARPKGRSRDLDAALASRVEIDLGCFEVHSCFLFHSILRSEGATYLKLRDFPLGRREEGAT